MIALDTNVLVYARRTQIPHHAAATALLTGLAEGSDPWALPWPVVYEFVRVVTHPRVFAGAASGNLAHDAHSAALVAEHGVTELLTADRDFARFPGVRTRNPFAA